MQNTIQHGTFLRNGSNHTVQVLFTTDANTVALKPIDYEGGIKYLSLSILQQLYKNRYYVIVKDPKNIHERILAKQTGAERFLVK